MNNKHFKFCLDEVLRFGGTTIGRDMITAYAYAKGIEEDKISYENIPDEWKYEIYKRTYWDKFRGDEIDKSISIFLLDYAIQSGVVQTIKTLQRALRDLDLYCGKIDGVFSFQTSQGIKKCNSFIDLLNKLKQYRLKFIYTLKDYPKYKEAWTKRIEIIYSIGMNLFTWQEVEPVPSEDEIIETDMGAIASPDDIYKPNKGLIGFLAGLGLTISAFKEVYDISEPFVREIINLDLGIPINILIGALFLIISVYLWVRNRNNDNEI